MDQKTRAARGRRKTWQGHDERDSEMVVEGARTLYSALTGEDEISRAAGQMVKDAFWMADEAEKYQGTDAEREEVFYGRATRLLKEARDMAGLDWSPMEHRGNGWWKAYRRREEEKLEEQIREEHQADLGSGAEYEEATGYLLAASEKHAEDDWQGVQDKLENYYDIVLEEFRD